MYMQCAQNVQMGILFSKVAILEGKKHESQYKRQREPIRS